MKARLATYLIALLLTLPGCIPVSGGIEVHYTLLVDGDTGKVVTITHLERRGKYNEEVTRSVTIPHYDDYITLVDSWRIPEWNMYVKVHSDGETQVKFVLFCNNGPTLSKDDGCSAWAWYMSRREQDANKGCERYDTWTMDSLYHFLDEVRYPTYKVMTTGETDMEVVEDKRWKDPNARY